MTNPRLTILFDRYISGEISPSEELEFNNLIQDPTNKDSVEELLDRYILEKPADADMDADSRDAILQSIFKVSPGKPKRILRKMYWLRRVVAAAVVIFCFGAVFYLIQSKKSNPTETATTHTEITPGRNKAVLTLADGSKITLDSVQAGSSVSQNNTNIVKADSATLIYHDIPGPTENIQTSLNTLSTPRGGQYQLTLSDGTKVWLNAASSITYPTSFNGPTRNVKITGELYFEVAKNAKKPFVVSTGNTEVLVLGTHFNVNAYADEAFVAVTLVEGSVKTSKGSESKIIVPGDQAQISNQGIKVLKDVNVNGVVSWKDGRILFTDANLPMVMRMISRWYDVDVIYEGDVPERSITGGIPRTASFSEILKVLEWNKIHFRQDNKTIIITP